MIVAQIRNTRDGNRQYSMGDALWAAPVIPTGWGIMRERILEVFLRESAAASINGNSPVAVPVETIMLETNISFASPFLTGKTFHTRQALETHLVTFTTPSSLDKASTVAFGPQGGHMFPTPNNANICNQTIVEGFDATMDTLIVNVKMSSGRVTAAKTVKSVPQRSNATDAVSSTSRGTTVPPVDRALPNADGDGRDMTNRVAVEQWQQCYRAVVFWQKEYDNAREALLIGQRSGTQARTSGGRIDSDDDSDDDASGQSIATLLTELERVGKTARANAVQAVEKVRRDCTRYMRSRRDVRNAFDATLRAVDDTLFQLHRHDRKLFPNGTHPTLNKLTHGQTRSGSTGESGLRRRHVAKPSRIGESDPGTTQSSSVQETSGNAGKGDVDVDAKHKHHAHAQHAHRLCLEQCLTTLSNVAAMEPMWSVTMIIA